MTGADIIKSWICEVFGILRYYAVSISSHLLMFWGSLWVPSSRVKQSKKVKLFLSVPSRHIVRVEIHLQWFFTSPLYADKSPASWHSHLTISPPPTINSPGTQWIGGWVGPSTQLGILDERFLSQPKSKLHINQHINYTIPAPRFDICGNESTGRYLSRKGVKWLCCVWCYINTAVRKLCSRIWGHTEGIKSTYA